jgi:acyl-CoA synthetase (AMP-forming)/AMP-acid ligase II
MSGDATDVTTVTPVGDILVRNASRDPDCEAIVIGDTRRTHAELLAAAERAARSLLGLGIRPGDRVGFLMPNCLDFVEVMWGCALIGAPILAINARFKAVELGHVIGDSSPVAVITTDAVSEYVDFVPLLDDATERGSGELLHRVLLGDSSPAGYVDRRAFDEAGCSVPVEAVHRERRSVRVGSDFVLLYTSGTTSLPKACTVTHEALSRTAEAIGERWSITAEDRMWCPLPLFHMGGILPMTIMLAAGGTDVSMPRFEPGAALRLLEGERCTLAWPAFPTFTQGMIHHPDFRTTDLSRVRGMIDTGGYDALEQVQRAWPEARVVTCYGSTETCAIFAIGALDDPEDLRLGSGGRPLRGGQVRIVDPLTGGDVEPGVSGEIVVRGPCVTSGYHNDEAKNAEAFRDGWFHSGDLGRLDAEGHLTYEGRLKDMLKVGGENVAAIEIEAHLALHPAVKIAQVVGIPDPKYLEVPAAFIELAPDCVASEVDLIAHCQGRIASFKVPRHIRFVDGSDWPLSATKIQKFVLRERLIEELQMAEQAR